MTNNNVKWKNIQRWWPLLAGVVTLAVTGSVAFTGLKMRVDAIEARTNDKGTELRTDFEETKLRQDMLILKQAELIAEFEKKLIRLEMVVEYMEDCD